MKTVWCRYHRGYVTEADAQKIRTGRGRGVVAHICNRCQAIRTLPKNERDEAAEKVVKEQRQLRYAVSKEWKSYKKKIKEISQ
jgi:hypothetical protein